MVVKLTIRDKKCIFEGQNVFKMLFDNALIRIPIWIDFHGWIRIRIELNLDLDPQWDQYEYETLIIYIVFFFWKVCWRYVDRYALPNTLSLRIGSIKAASLSNIVFHIWHEGYSYIN